MNFEIWQLALLGGVGFMSGWINVMAGGGSLITIPIMLFMGIPAPVANGTNRIGILFQNISAIYGFFRKGFHQIQLSLSLAACATLGAIVGASLGVQIEGRIFNYFLIAVMLAVMLLTALGQKNENHQEDDPKNLWLGHFCMIGAGFWGGMIQIGIGFILMPILNRIMGFNLVHTNMHKVTIIACYTVAALIVFAIHIEILWLPGIILALGTSTGAYLGVHTTVVKGDRWIKWVLYITLTAFVIRLLFS